MQSGMETVKKLEVTDLKLKCIILLMAACSLRQQAALAEPLSEPASAAATFGTFGFPSMEPMEPGATTQSSIFPIFVVSV